jgi:nitric oxide reductase NorE protein
MPTDGPDGATAALGDHPGTTGIWTFVFIDMVIFFLFFGVYVTERHRLPDIFAQSQHQLSPLVGLMSTLALLTSSWAMAEAVHALRAADHRKVARAINWALALGAVFILNKLFEYGDKFGHGITPLTNGFFTFYFLITGLHFLHVTGGMIFMAHCRARLGVEAGEFSYRKKLENVGLFWHFVDVLWLFIFPMLYLTELVG